MNKSEKKAILGQIWNLNDHISDLEFYVKEGKKKEKDLMDYVELAEQQLRKIESLLNSE